MLVKLFVSNIITDFVLLHMLVKLFVSNIITDLSFNLSELQYKHFRKLFEVGS